MNRHWLYLVVTLTLAGSVQAQIGDPRPLVEKAHAAVDGEARLLKMFRFKEIFRFGSIPAPDEGKKRSTRESVFSQPDRWWLGKKERGEDPAKDDVRASASAAALIPPWICTLTMRTGFSNASTGAATSTAGGVNLVL